MHIGKLFAAVGDHYFILELAHLQEGNRFVIRPFGVELQLAVLVGHAQRLGGGLSAVNGHSLAGHVLAKALRPQLAEPVRHILEAVRVRHYNLYVFVPFFHSQILQHGIQQGGILPEVVGFTTFVHRGCAFQHGADVNSANCRGQQAHRR